ncbi:MAG TPA: hypothetical protein PKW95_15465 [bacterium]|nr:hypothetical protein [bacterium]
MTGKRLNTYIGIFLYSGVVLCALTGVCFADASLLPPDIDGLSIAENGAVDDSLAFTASFDSPFAAAVSSLQAEYPDDPPSSFPRTQRVFLPTAVEFSANRPHAPPR